MENLAIKDIAQIDHRTLGIIWSDEKVSRYDVVNLRRKCPCASCIDEWTRENKLKPEDIKDDVRPMQVQSVGRYALNIKFSDGHSTGIYTYKMLRDLPSP